MGFVKIDGIGILYGGILVYCGLGAWGFGIGKPPSSLHIIFTNPFITFKNTFKWDVGVST